MRSRDKPENLVAAWRFGGIRRTPASAAAGATTTATSAGPTASAATTRTARARATASRAATATLAAAASARTALIAATGAAATTTAAPATGTARPTANDGLSCTAEGVALGVPKGVDRADYNDRNAHNQKGIFGCVLTGFLTPEAFEKRDHFARHLQTEGT